MSEEEIINRLEEFTSDNVGFDKGSGLYQYNNKYYKEAVKGLLDLYNKEKEKNKKAIEYMERYEVNSTGKPFRYTEIGKELCEILEERN